MHALLRPLFAFFLHIGGFGLVILGVLDSSFFFLPFGNDLLLVVLVARHHGYLPLYVLAASLGSATGVLLLDLVCRKGGEEGTCADIQNFVTWANAREGRFHQMLGFGARNQDIRRDAEFSAVEFLTAGDVLRRLTLQALVQVAAVVDPGNLG